MTALLLALAALGVAPLLDRLLAGRRDAEGFADGFSQVAVAGLLLAHVVPAGFSASGWPAIVALVVGVVLGVGVHRLPSGESTAEWIAALGGLPPGVGTFDAPAERVAEAGFGFRVIRDFRG